MPGRAARLAGAARLRREHHAGPRPERRQHVRQGGPLRHRQHGALGDRDDRRLERLGQRRPRRIHRLRRSCAAREHVLRRGDLGGVGSGLYGMFFYIADRRLRRRADGRPDARIPRQEDRGARDEVRRHRGAVRAHDGPRHDGGRGRRRQPGSLRSSTRARTASARPCTPIHRRRTTTAARSPATARRTSRRRSGRSRLLLRPLRAAARRRSRSAGSLAARRGSRRPRPGPSAPTAPTFVVLLVGVIVAHGRPDDLPGARRSARSSRGCCTDAAQLGASIIAVVAAHGRARASATRR